MVDEARYARAVGLESFFAVARPAARWRMLVLTIAVMLPITTLFQLSWCPTWPVGRGAAAAAVGHLRRDGAGPC